MPVQTFRSPNFFDREIDQSAIAPLGPSGVPAGIIGTSNRGPAFIPVTVGDFNQFIATFGDLDPNRYGPYAANTFLANRSALTFLRVLGAGANASGTDIGRTAATGRVLNAGFHLDGEPAAGDGAGRYNNVVQFLVAQHVIQTAEAYGQADFTDNDSFLPGSSVVNLVRGVIIPASGSRIMIASMDHNLVGANITALNDMGQADANGNFKLIISTSLGSAFYSDDGNPGCHIVTASLDPSATNYFAKVLNTDPKNFVTMQHLVYSDFAVDDEIATVGTNGAESVGQVVGILQGSTHISAVAGANDTFTSSPYHDVTSFRSTFGAFDTRYQTPTTPNFISQPFGKTEFDLFRVEALDDGAYANNLYKISIANLQASTNAANKYGTFSVQVRSWDDTDINPNIIEQFNNCSLDPAADTYVAKVIGDRKLFYNFDAEDPSERRIIAGGKYQSNSSYIRVVMNDAVDRGQVPPACLPFGFRGVSVLKTNDALSDTTPGIARMFGLLSGSANILSQSIVPPVPFRSKVTKGTRPQSGWFGQPGSTEVTINTMYWGTKFERNDIPLNPNIETLPNNFLNSLTQFQGLSLLDTVVTGSGADTFNDNKFTLSKCAFPNGAISDLTSSVETTMLGTAYIRNGVVDSSQYTINDPVFGSPRITFATLLGKGTPAQFNRFANFTKFTTFMQGGFDGTNFLDIDAERMNDKATCFESSKYGSGGAFASYVPAGFGAAQSGYGQQNSTVSSYITAINIMTDPLQINHNILAIPGIREPFITDYAGNAVKAYGLAYNVMDLERFDESGLRMFDDSVNAAGSLARPDVNQTAAGLDTRGIDNNYMGVYFPDIFINDTTNNRRVKVPASIAALGALGFNDRVGYPWFAPAGFNRASLDFVTNVEVRLTASDRDTLYDARINPIATFPRQGFAIFGQKTLQIKSSALDRVNVRRLLLEVKRIIIGIAMQLEFEQNTPALWNTFVSQASLQLGLIQAQQGIEAFQVIMNETNNTDIDAQLNRLNGRIVVVPTRVIEFIAIDFCITNSGVVFT